MPLPCRGAACAALLALLPAPSLPGEVWIPGVSEAIDDASLAFPVPGILGVREFSIGARVESGSIIASLDTALDELEVERRRLLMEAARKDYERTRQVFERGSIVSEEEVEAKESAWRVAETEHRLALEQLERRRIRAPFSGIIVETFGVEPGEAVERNQPVVRVADSERCRFVVFVDGDASFGLKAGDSARLRFRIGVDVLHFEGTVTFVSPVVDPASGLAEVRINFTNPDARIKPGMAGEATFVE